MESKEQNHIRQLLLELEDYLFSLKWFNKEGSEMMLKNIIGFDSIFQIIPKRFHKLLEGKIYTQYELAQELDKAREEGKNIGWKDCEKFYKDLRSILRPYHQEREDYRTTLKRLLSKLKDNK